MMGTFTERLNAILPRISSDEFLTSSGIGNEIAFYIFDYPPEEELQVRDHIRFLLEQLPKLKPALRVKHINLFDFGHRAPEGPQASRAMLPDAEGQGRR